MLGVQHKNRRSAQTTQERMAQEMQDKLEQAIQEQQAQTMEGHEGPVVASAFFKDGRRVVTASGYSVRIWDVGDRVQVGTLGDMYDQQVFSVAISPDDRRVASGGNHHKINIWDIESRQKVFDPLEGHTGGVRSVCFSPDSKRLASGSDDETIVLWDAETGAVLAILEGHFSSVCSVAFSPDGLKLASGSTDNTLRVWSTDNAEQLLEIDAHPYFVVSVVWTPDSQQLVSTSNDRTFKFWNSSNGDQIGEPCFTYHTHYINSLAISFDGSFIATASYDNTVRLWSTKTRQQIGQPFDHTVSVRCVAISPNGELLVSGDDGHRVWLRSIKDVVEQHKLEERTKEDEEAQRQPVSHDINDEPVADNDNPSDRPSETDEALLDAEKVIERDPLSYLGYELRHAALHGTQRYVEAILAFKTMLSKLDDAPDPQIQKLSERYVSLSEVEKAIHKAIHAQLEDAPLRLLNTSDGRLCNREAQIITFIRSTEYMEIFSSSLTHTPLHTDSIREAVAKYFSWVMLSHRWERKEPLLHDIQDKAVYDLDPVGTNVKLQKFCEVTRDAGYHWAWVDTCCIDQNNNVELQESVNSMFVWYRHSALTIVYLSDVPPSSKSGALANSTWNTRGWTVQEFLAPNIVIFYQADWTLYLDDRSPNHKKSVTIMQELEHATGINARALVAFRPGMRGAREKLQWASNRVTTLQEDVAYSLFGIFHVHLPVIYGEKRQNALGRLLQEIVARSGDITALDWIGKSSEFNSCLPADITSYKTPPCMLSSVPEDEMQTGVSRLQNGVAVESALKLYTLLDNLGVPRFANSRLQLPCIVFPVVEVRRRPGQDGDKMFTYDVKADGLQDLSITTADKLIQFSQARATQQTFLLIRPWNRDDLGLPDFGDDTESVDGSMAESLLDDFPAEPAREDGPDDLDPQSRRSLKLIVRLGQPFGALLLAQKRGLEYKRIASDNNIMAQVRAMDAVHDTMDIRTLEIV